MSEKKEHISDEEVQRILSEYQKEKEKEKRQSSPSDKKEKAKERKTFEDRVDAKYDYVMDHTLRRMHEFIFDKTFHHIVLHFSRNQGNPYVAEFLLGFFQCIIFFCYIPILGLIFFILSVFGIIDFDGFIVSVLILLFGFFAFLVITFLNGLLTNPSLLGMFIDKISGQKQKKERISMEGIYGVMTSDAFSKEDITIIDQLYPEECCAVPSALMYLVLPTEANPKQSKRKGSFHTYEQEYLTVPKGCHHVNFILTLQKSDLIDKLLALEPTGEFQITYLRFSRILKEIHPIPGWNYAEGVEEICDRINALYP